MVADCLTMALAGQLAGLQLKRLKSSRVQREKNPQLFGSASARCFCLILNYINKLPTGQISNIYCCLFSSSVQVFFSKIFEQVPSWQSCNDVFFKGSARRTSETAIWLREIHAPGANSAPVNGGFPRWVSRKAMRMSLLQLGECHSYPLMLV